MALIPADQTLLAVGGFAFFCYLFFNQIPSSIRHAKWEKEYEKSVQANEQYLSKDNEVPKEEYKMKIPAMVMSDNQMWGCVGYDSSYDNLECIDDDNQLFVNIIAHYEQLGWTFVREREQNNIQEYIVLLFKRTYMPKPEPQQVSQPSAMPQPDNMLKGFN